MKIVIDLYQSLVKELTAEHDESHDYSHHLEVLQNASKILDKCDLPQHEKNIILTAAFVHDTIDHKYKGVAEKFVVLKKKLLEQNTPEDVERILYWISKVSFSKQIKDQDHLQDHLQDQAKDQSYINILRDADRIEALGKIGLERCRQYSEAKNPGLSEKQITVLMVQHCKEKLLRLLPERFIVTEVGRQLAEPGHKVIEQFVSNFEKRDLRDLNYYENCDKMFWVIAHDLVAKDGTVFKQYEKIPCLYVEKVADQDVGSSQRDLGSSQRDLGSSQRDLGSSQRDQAKGIKPKGSSCKV